MRELSLKVVVPETVVVPQTVVDPVVEVETVEGEPDEPIEVDPGVLELEEEGTIPDSGTSVSAKGQ
jgi:hypothetical protein